MKVLYVSIFNIPHVGGLSTRLVAEANFLASKGHEVYVLSEPPESEGLEKKFDPRVVRHVYTPVSPGGPAAISKIRKLSQYVRVIRKLERLHRFDVVHAHDIYSALYAIIAGVGKKTVLTMHSVYSADLKVMGEQRLPPLRKYLFAPMKNVLDVSAEHLVYRKIRTIICVSEYEADDVRRKSGKEPVILRNWVDTEKFKPAGQRAARKKAGFPQEARIGIFVGRMVAKNGVETIARAAVEATKKLPWLEFYFVGDGSERAACEKAVKLARARRVTFLGARTDTPVLLCASDFFVSHVSSLVDGVGITVLEAASAGKPVICGRDRISGRIFGHAKDVWLVEKDDAHALAAAMEKMASDQELRSRIGSAARRKAEREFSMAHALNRLQSILEKVAS
jgi:glycosyltransferase involved in cell wall biosynthesis